MRDLYKTTIVIWSDEDPEGIEIDALAREAISGDFYCSTIKHSLISDVTSDPDWDGTEFFDLPEVTS